MSEASQETDVEKTFASPPDALTDAGWRYFRDFETNIGFTGFVADLAQRADLIRWKAAEALIPGEDDPEKRAELEAGAKDKKATTRILRERFGQHLLETVLSRGVDNYLTYIAELMAEVFKTRPETLHSAGEVKISFVLQHETMADLLDALAERRIDRLAYAGVRTLQSNLQDTLGFTVFQTEDEVKRAVRVIEDRNLIVHNRGIVSRRYLTRLSDSSRKLGDRLDLDVDTVFEDLGFLTNSAGDIDQRAAAKWGMKQRDWKEEGRGAEPAGSTDGNEKQDAS